MSDQRDGGIAWTDQTWNPVRGCSRVSAGCVNCYAEKVAARFSGPGLPYEGLTRSDGRWNGVVRLVPQHLADPLRWRRPRRVFVNSMSDLFHESLPNETIAAVFGVMAASPAHTFQVLTKRADRMREWFAWIASPKASTLCFEAADRALIDAGIGLGEKIRWTLSDNVQNEWPLPNVWLGVSVEDQKTADERIPALLDTRAAVRFVSYEPALGPVDFTRIDGAALNPKWRGLRLDALTGGSMSTTPWHLNWIIVGGESGEGARPFDVAWARSTIDACRSAGVACFVKQLGSKVEDDARVLLGDGSPWRAGTRFCSYFTDERVQRGERPRCAVRLRDRKGGDLSEWPEDLRVREFPRAKGAP